jgi:hypothetical protein
MNAGADPVTSFACGKIRLRLRIRCKISTPSVGGVILMGTPSSCGHPIVQIVGVITIVFMVENIVVRKVTDGWIKTAVLAALK